MSKFTFKKDEKDYDQFDILIIITRLFKKLNSKQQDNLLKDLRGKIILERAEQLNRYGNERAKCPNCNEYQDKAYEFMKEDWRQFECVFCKKSSQYALYFQESLEKLK